MTVLAAVFGWLRARRSAWAMLATVGAILATAVVFAVVGRAGERRVRAAEAAAEAAVRGARADAAIKEMLAVERQQKALDLERAQHQLEAADDGEVDAIPSDARRAYLCGVLRSQAGGRGAPPATCRP